MSLSSHRTGHRKGGVLSADSLCSCHGHSPRLVGPTSISSLLGRELAFQLRPTVTQDCLNFTSTSVSHTTGGRVGGVMLSHSLPSPPPLCSLSSLSLKISVSYHVALYTHTHQGRSSFLVTCPCVCWKNLLPGYRVVCLEEGRRGGGPCNEVILCDFIMPYCCSPSAFWELPQVEGPAPCTGGGAQVPCTGGVHRCAQAPYTGGDPSGSPMGCFTIFIKSYVSTFLNYKFLISD